MESTVCKFGLVLVVIRSHVQRGRSNVAAALGVCEAQHIGNGEIALGDRRIDHKAHIAAEGILAIDRQGECASRNIVPDGAHYRALGVIAFKVKTHGKEGLLVGVLQVTAEAVVEIWRKVRVTKGNRQRIAVVGHGHEL